MDTLNPRNFATFSTCFVDVLMMYCGSGVHGKCLASKMHNLILISFCGWAANTSKEQQLTEI
jgi:hypothetical protein